MPDIVTLTINPSIDIFVNVGHVEPTRKMRCLAPKRGGAASMSPASRIGWVVTSRRSIRPAAPLAQVSPAPKFVVANGRKPPSVLDDFFARVVGQAKTMGAKPVVDTTGPALSRVLREGAAIIEDRRRQRRRRRRQPSTAAVMSPGTELSREADVKRLLPQVRITEVMAALT